MINDLAQRTNGNGNGNYDEVGTSGLNVFYGIVNEAFHPELRWPAAFDEINRIWRTDPEIAIAKTMFQTFASEVKVQFEANPDEESKSLSDEAVTFGNSVLGELDGGISAWLQQMATRVPFFGWGWCEEVIGLRQAGWKPPGDDDWRSRENDGLIGIRRLAFRDPSSFYQWEMDDKTGHLNGMWQQDMPNPNTLIPLDKSVHLTFGGDRHNPEGVSPLEAVWRLERIKYNLERVQGIGHEHSAGHLKIETARELSATDKAAIKAAAKAVLTAQESNYLALPNDIKAEIMDVTFANAGAILEAIRYYGLLKLQLYNMQWVSIASTAGTGAYAAADSASGMFILYFNSMIESFVNQLDAQMGRRLFEKHNAQKFAGLMKRPRLKASKIEQTFPLKDLAEFWQIIQQTMPTDEKDQEAIRVKSRILPEAVPEEQPQPEPPPTPTPATPPGDTTPEDQMPMDQQPTQEQQPSANLQEGGPVIAKGAGQPLPEIPDTVEYTEEEINAAVERWKAVAPAEFKGLIDAEVE